MSTAAWIGIALCGGLGAVARLLAGNTLLVNVSGAFALGVLVGAGAGGDALRIAAVGFLGSYTTFSTWVDGGRRMPGYLVAGLTLGLAAVWLGRTVV